MLPLENSPEARACKMRGRAFIQALVATALLFGGVGGISVASSQEGESILSGVDLARGEVILGLAGYDGSPLPDRWLVLVGKPGTSGSLREMPFSGGKAGVGRAIESRAGHDLPHLPIDPAMLRCSAAEAHQIAAAKADAVGARWIGVHYHLRVREEELEPVWILTFVNRAQVKVGLVSLSARTGDVLRESWPQIDSGPLAHRTLDSGKVSAR